MTRPEVLLLEGIGGAYTEATVQARGLGGSEIEILQVARGLTDRGYTVAVANGVESIIQEAGITYVPHAQAWQYAPTKALYLQRWNTPESRMEIASDVRVIVRANDLCCPPYEVHRYLLTSGRAALVANTQWQADTFTYARERIVIHPMLEPMPVVPKIPGLFVFASGAMKGFDATVAKWRDLKARYPHLAPARLAMVSPGWGEPRDLSPKEVQDGIFLVGSPTPALYREWIAKAEGLFMVNTMIEVFGCVGALAERAGTKTHILCLHGLGGFAESIQNRNYVTDNPQDFEDGFLKAFGLFPVKPNVPDLTPAVLIPQWEEALHLSSSTRSLPVNLSSGFPDDPTLTENQAPLGPFFGDFLSYLRSAIAPGGSEFGAGLMLFSLASAIQAREIVEIGRFKGFSTLALAAACKLQDLGWIEPQAAEQRPEIDYRRLKVGPARVLSIDPSPRPEAHELLERAGLLGCVEFRNERSEITDIEKPIDLLFVDGDHSVTGLRADLQRFVPWVRPGGYFILHDYFGWFTPEGKNGSPIAQVITEDLHGCDRVLIDTHYASLVIFRKAQYLTERWELPALPERIPARADGRPTVGLCLIAKGDEVSTVATRAIRTAQRAGVDCVTVVCDAQNETAEVVRSLGADVFIRSTPVIDWTHGYGVIAGARNEALAIAERRTDYVLVIDADDAFEGVLPAILDRDAYEVTIQDGGIEYRRVQLFRSALQWRYRGIIHETLEMRGSGPIGYLASLTYQRGRSALGFQDTDPPAVKYGKHAQLAQKWLLDHPDDARMQFYLARSYQDAGQLALAQIAYQQRLDMLQGWDEERSYAAFQIGLIQVAQGQDPTSALLQAYSIGVPKAEPLVALARWYRDEARRQFTIAMIFAQQAAVIPKPAHGLFVEPWIYQFEAAAEVAICAYWLGDKLDALTRFEALIPRVPKERRQWLDTQIALCVRETAQRQPACV